MYSRTHQTVSVLNIIMNNWYRNDIEIIESFLQCINVWLNDIVVYKPVLEWMNEWMNDKVVLNVMKERNFSTFQEGYENLP